MCSKLAAETHYLISGSSDGAIMAWKIGSGKGEWSHALQLPGVHKKGVTCLAGRMVSDTVSIFASTSSDGTVVIWEMVVEPTAGGSCKVSCLCSLSVGSKPMVSLSLAVLPEQEGHLILTMGGLYHKVHIYCGDQSGKTTRIFAPWRSQVNPGDGTGNHRFVSGSDEKVSRVFEAPLSFLKTLQEAALLKLDNSEYFDNVQVLGANMSALGLSQKPIYTHGVKESPSNICNNGPDSIETIPDAVPTVFTEPPVEDQLARNTLWPESHKLYGHGNELFSICCDHAGKLVASSCKAQSAPVADIWLWEVGTWKAVGHLQYHNLTVTQMKFSCDNSFLLSVSRDRHLSVFSTRKTEEGAEHHLIAKQGHKSIIWACSWNLFGYEFATGSRDNCQDMVCSRCIFCQAACNIASVP